MKKYAFAGASYRGFYMYADNLSKHFEDCAQIVGIFDPNQKRCEFYVKELGKNIGIFSDFDTMIQKSKPDIVIVTTVDRYHHEYIIRAMELGCDVITEKPLTIDVDKYNLIAEVQKRTGKKLNVAFNYRFGTFAARIKELIMDGAVGEILNINFEWLLDTDHGADYFRRWHRYKENSGGLLVHKATHHFDLINWLTGQNPVAVNAFGTRRFYGYTREQRGERCYTCKYKDQCEFCFDITADELIRKIYFECESEDGYYRDRCVFADDISIEDSMSVNVRYSGGTVMSYSLSAFSPYEGYRLCINGKNGRLVAEDLHGAIGFAGGKQIYNLRLYNRYGEEIVYNIPDSGGAFTKTHGGGDIRLLNMIIRGGMEDRLGQVADLRAGAMSIITGIAANISIKEGRQVLVKDLIK
jgi:Predicted dehydrogenases and related proteins